MTRGFLASLQLGDTSLPIGRFVHSLGLEALLGADDEAGEAEILEIVMSMIAGSAGSLDAIALAASHRATTAGDLDRLLELDRSLELYKLAPPSREASRECGGRLAALALRLTDREPAGELCRRVTRNETAGHLAVVEGAVAAALEIGCEEAVLLELRGAATTLLTAAVRLGRLTAFRAQQMLHELEPLLLRTAADALTADVGEMSTSVFELEAHAMAHRRSDARMFAT